MAGLQDVFDYKAKLYDLELFEYIIETEHHLRVTRIPGGWLFENMQFGSMCFVPYSDEFMPKNRVN